MGKARRVPGWELENIKERKVVELAIISELSTPSLILYIEYHRQTLKRLKHKLLLTDPLYLYHGDLKYAAESRLAEIIMIGGQYE